MRAILIVLIGILIISSSAFCWYDTKYDTVETRWPNGNLKEYYTRAWFLGNEKGFRPHRQYSSYYETGVPKEQGTYEWNVKSGIWISWYENGSRKEEVNYLNGLKIGRYIERHPDHTIKALGYYNNDKKGGVWTHRKQGDDINNPNLYIISMGYYVNDSLLVLLEEDGGGSIHENKSFYNGEFDLWIEWKRHSSIDWLNNYIEFDIGKKLKGQKHGKWIKRAANGEIIDIEYYVNGKLN